MAQDGVSKFGLRGSLLTLSVFSDKDTGECCDWQRTGTENTAVPLLEALVPAGPGQIVVGAVLAYAGNYWTDESQSLNRWSMLSAGLTLGYLLPLVQWERSTLWVGPRTGLGYAWGRMKGPQMPQYKAWSFPEDLTFVATAVAMMEFRLAAYFGLGIEGGVGGVLGPKSFIDFYDADVPGGKWDVRWGAEGHATFSAIARF
jgi:hypothetical protein